MFSVLCLAGRHSTVCLKPHLIGLEHVSKTADVRFPSVRSTACFSACGWPASAVTRQSRSSPGHDDPPSLCHCCTKKCQRDRSRCAELASPVQSHRHTHKKTCKYMCRHGANDKRFLRNTPKLYLLVSQPENLHDNMISLHVNMFLVPNLRI